jgi:hypothetical protein
MNKEQLTTEMQGPDDYQSSKSLSKVLNIKSTTINEWCRKYPDFPHLSLPGTIRLKSSEVMKWLADHAEDFELARSNARKRGGRSGK